MSGISGQDQDNPLASIAGAGWLLLVIVAEALNAFAEELVMRGYLLTRLASMLKSKVSGIALSSALSTLCHIYYDFRSVLSVFVISVISSVSFGILGRLWPVIFVHFLIDVLVRLGGYHV